MATYEIKLFTYLDVNTNESLQVRHEVCNTVTVKTNDITEQLKELLKTKKDVERVEVKKK